MREVYEGNQCGYWTVLEYLGRGYYRCKCVCGNTRRVATQSLRHNRSSSCGCMSANLIEQAKKKREDEIARRVTIKVEPDYK